MKLNVPGTHSAPGECSQHRATCATSPSSALGLGPMAGQGVVSLVVAPCCSPGMGAESSPACRSMLALTYSLSPLAPAHHRPRSTRCRLHMVAQGHSSCPRTPSPPRSSVARWQAAVLLLPLLPARVLSPSTSCLPARPSPPPSPSTAVLLMSIHRSTHLSIRPSIARLTWPVLCPP